VFYFGTVAKEGTEKEVKIMMYFEQVKGLKR